MTDLNNSVGLYNLGNTCYMNSAIQILVNNNVFSNYFINNEFTDDNLIKFKKFVTQYKSSTNSFPPVGVKEIVAEKHEMFGGFLQNDSHEFIVLLLDVLEEALKKEEKDNVIEKLYDFKLSSILKCKIKGSPGFGQFPDEKAWSSITCNTLLNFNELYDSFTRKLVSDDTAITGLLSTLYISKSKHLTPCFNTFFN